MVGWSALAERFPDDSTIFRTNHTWNSARLGWFSYNNCLTIGISDEGLHLSILLPFQLFHPPMLVPWDQFHSTWKRSFPFFHGTETYIGVPTIAQLNLPAYVYDELIERESQIELVEEA